MDKPASSRCPGGGDRGSTPLITGTSFIRWCASRGRWRTIVISRVYFLACCSAWPTMICRRIIRRPPIGPDEVGMKILELAAGEGEDRVEQVLRGLLARGEAITEAGVREGMPTPAWLPLWEVPVYPVLLSAYDALLSAPEVMV